jgi:hypothetical protein
VRLSKLLTVLNEASIMNNYCAIASPKRGLEAHILQKLNDRYPILIVALPNHYRTTRMNASLT